MDCNVVQFTNLNSQKRDPCPDLATLYLVEPCQETYKKISQDARQKLYDIMIVLFTKPPTDLQAFVQEMQGSGQAHRVIEVQCCFVGGYQVITPNFFTWPAQSIPDPQS